MPDVQQAKVEDAFQLQSRKEVHDAGIGNVVVINARRDIQLALDQTEDMVGGEPQARRHGLKDVELLPLLNIGQALAQNDGVQELSDVFGGQVIAELEDIGQQFRAQVEGVHQDLRNRVAAGR